MNRRFLLEWLGLTFATAIAVPASAWVAMMVRMVLVGDKPAGTMAEIEAAENLQWAVQIATYLVCVALFSIAALLILKRK
ncbi:hypothetical protein [Novosphingobium sp. KACC 22771]|uniref:hypothetical protein n=1 Tax=Novosphingobium sp. KACC 22771 TaxID=3025670 RepID=UPI00236516B2|nr:hypothetical protein [Novosphingobium sp. KACC 22771]WDF72825.1 hypothetical protein PQ467_01940 [Novosphingobium sp. KACC 22771]